MYVDPSIFHAYDIRGQYPQEVNEENFFKIAKALGQMISGSVVVGVDARTSSPALLPAVLNGLYSAAGDSLKIIPVGMVTTPMMYFLVNHLNAGGGVIVTASHNPKQDNGLKIVGPKAQPISCKEVLAFVEKNEAALESLPRKEWEGKAEGSDAYYQAYADFIAPRLTLARPMKIVVDSSNGTTGLVVKALAKKLSGQPLVMIPINDQPDGNFPAHGPNPLLAGAMDELCERVISEKADLGVIFDSDGDRIMFVDNLGREIYPDNIFILLAQNFSGPLILDVRGGWLVRDYLAKEKREVIDSKVGHVFIKQLMQKTDAEFAGEFSGHYYFKESFGVESGFFTLAFILNSISRLPAGLAKWIDSLPHYARSGEVNFNVAGKEAKAAAMKKLEESFTSRAAATSHLDGVKIEINDSNTGNRSFWFSARPSGNEDLLRLIIEAVDEPTLAAARAEITGMISAFAKK